MENISPISSSSSEHLPSVAVVILNWNGRKFLEQFLPSVLQTVYPNFSVVVADNASTDDSLKFLQNHYPQVSIIQNPDNEGFARGYNLALKNVKADYYVLLNSDVEVTPGWMGSVVALMESDLQIAACQPKVLSYHEKNVFEYAGASGGWIDYLGYPFSRGRVFDVCEADEGQYEDAVPCFWATGAAFFVRSNLFHEMRGFDPFFFAHQEEIDLCWRMQLAGYKVYVQPASIVFHVGGGTLPKGDSLKTFLNFRNNLIMMFKNYHRPNMYWILPMRILLDAIAAWKNLLAGDGGFFKAVFRAHLHFLKWVLSGKLRKESIFPAKRGRPMIGWYTGSVVYNYFLQGKKLFSQIVKRN